MSKRKIASFMFILALWQFFAMMINNNIFLPTPFEVLNGMFDTFSSNILLHILASLQKVLWGFGIALLLSMLFAFLAMVFKTIEIFIDPFYLLIRTIPNITYMFILLLYTTSEKAVIWIVFFIVFPILYETLLKSKDLLDQDLKDVLILYGETRFTQIQKIYFPHAMIHLKNIFYSTLCLALKVCIMSEVIGQVRYGIGKQMYIDKINLDMVGVFAWTIWIIIIVLIIENIPNVVRWVYNKVHVIWN